MGVDNVVQEEVLFHPLTWKALTMVTQCFLIVQSLFSTLFLENYTKIASIYEWFLLPHVLYFPF